MLSLISSFYTCRRLKFCKVNGCTQVQKLISDRASPTLQVFDFKFMDVNCTTLLTQRIYSGGNFFIPTLQQQITIE